MTPIVKITNIRTGLEFINIVTSFAYNESTEKDNELSITLKFKNVYDFDNFDILEGDKLEFYFGFSDRSVSRKKTCKVLEKAPIFTNVVTMSIKALDLGSDLKRLSSKKVYQNKTISAIFSEIADNFKLTQDIEPTKKVYKNIPQAGKSYWNFLKQLESMAETETDGDLMTFYCVGDKLLFKKNNTSKASLKSFLLGVDIVNFSPKYKNTQNTGQGSTAFGIDTEKNEVFKVESNTENQETQLGNNTTNYSFNGVEISKIEGANGKTTNPNVEIKKEGIKKAIVNETKKAPRKILTASMQIILSPELETDQIVTIKGVGKEFSGNWYIKALKHSIVPTGLTTLELQKNATGKVSSINGSIKSKIKNKTVGGGEIETTVEINEFKYDFNGNLK